MHPALSAYLESEVARSAHYNEQTQSFHYTKHGRPIQCGGIHGWLRTLFYSHYVRNRSDRNHKQVSLIGSTHAQGKLVDAQLEAITRGKMSMTHRKMHKMTRAIVEWLHARGHTLEAAQVPVELAQGWGRMTCADLITRNKADGKLWVWEIKTGFPVGFYRSQGNFANAPLEDVPCTQQNIWFLQLHYTHQALCTMARLPIEGGCSRILQVYLKKQGRGKPAALIVEEHAPPAWLTARVPLMAPPPLGLGVPVSKKKRPAPEGDQVE